MVEAHVPLKAAQERLGHSRPDILLKFYAHVLDASADAAAESLSGQLSGTFLPRNGPKRLFRRRLCAYWQLNGS